MPFLALVVLTSVVAPHGWQFRTLVPGEGPAARVGDRVVVHFVASDELGNRVADTERRGLTYSFVVGKGSSNPALDRGVRGMRVGAVRRLVAPPSMVAGLEGNPPVVSAGATLRIVLRLMKIEPRDQLAVRLAVRRNRSHTPGSSTLR